MTWLAVAVIAAFLAAVLRRYTPEHGLALGLAAGSIIVVAALSEALPLFRQLKVLLDRSGASNEYIGVLMRALGICLLTELAADTCRDAGEQGLASKAELVGKLALLTVALPLFQKVGDMALTLIGGTV